jgi:hypothetical protein
MKRSSYAAAILLLSISSIAHAQYTLDNGDWRRPIDDGVHAEFDSVAIGDLDGDGRQDLVAITAQHQVYIFRQRPDGTLAEAVKRSLMPEPCDPQELPCNYRWIGDVILADLTGDDRPEIIAPLLGGLATLSPLSSPRTPVIRHIYDADLGLVPYRLGVIDADSDGLHDVVAVDWDSGDLLTFYGDGAGGFTGHERTPIGTMFGAGLEVADLDGDGHEDIAYVERNGSQSRIHLLYGAVGGGFLAPQALEANDIEEGSVVLADVDDDGHTDLIHGPLVYRQLAPRSFTAASAEASLAAYNLRSGDLDGDGRRDLANVDWYANAVRYQLGTGNGFGPPASAPFAFGFANFGPVALAIGDLNNDGCGDVAAGAGTIGVTWLLGSGCVPRPDLAANVGIAATSVTVRVDNLGAAAADASSLEVNISLNGGTLAIKSIPNECSAIAGASSRFHCALDAMADGAYRTLTFTLGTSGVNARSTLAAKARVSTAQQEVRTTNNTASKLFKLAVPKAAGR